LPPATAEVLAPPVAAVPRPHDLGFFLLFGVGRWILHSDGFWSARMSGLTAIQIRTERGHVTTEASKFTQWRKSSRSSAYDNCVEVAVARDGHIGVRDSKQRGQGPVLEFAPSEWQAFLGGVKDGEFDR
jgi:Domain of unknown function (DUF397)